MIEPQKFRKQPVEIEALQWTGDNLKEIIEFTGKHPQFDEWFDTWQQYESFVEQEGFKVFTLEGSLLASVGDWIIKGLKGEFYPCKPDIFEQSYETADQEQNPLLGLATTRQLLDEIRARLELDGRLDYRTVDGGASSIMGESI